MNPNGTYYFTIHERDNACPSDGFVGRRYEQDGDALYWDEEGFWYYSFRDQVRGFDEGGVYIDSEALHCGFGIGGLLNNPEMRRWLEHMEFEGGLPPILRGYAEEPIDVRSDALRSDAAQDLLARLQGATKRGGAA